MLKFIVHIFPSMCRILPCLQEHHSYMSEFAFSIYLLINKLGIFRVKDNRVFNSFSLSPVCIKYCCMGYVNPLVHTYIPEHWCQKHVSYQKSPRYPSSLKVIHNYLTMKNWKSFSREVSKWNRETNNT